MDLKEIIQNHKLWLDGEGGEKANLRWADLRRADLRNCDLRNCDLCDCDLRWADLRGADLRNCNLHNCDLLYADLRNCDLRGANIDFSCWPLWSGSKGVIVDANIAAQLAAHFCALTCDDPAFLAAREALLPFARTSHRAGDLGVL